MQRAWVMSLRFWTRRVSPHYPACLRLSTGARIAAIVLFSGCIAGIYNQPAAAQEGRYMPLDQNVPVGRAGQWLGQIRQGPTGVLQPVQIVLPTSGKVTVYNGARQTGIDLGAPAEIAVGVGFAFRLKIRDMPEFPGVELYPTIETLDRLHPPPGRAQDFPVPIAFTSDEIQEAIDGRMVTKVVYLEQPQLAVTGDLTQVLLSRVLPPDRSLLIEADQVGRPMVLVRLGGRTPDDSRPDDGFFLPAAPWQIVAKQSRRSDADAGRTVVIDKATTFTPSSPRAEIEEENAVRLASRRGLSRPTKPRPYASLEPSFPPFELYPDEYLLDGGDRGFPVYEARATRNGLETEDAVAQYKDNLGNPHTLPTNRVAIYSPRFGTVGTSLGLEAGVTVARLASAIDLSRGEGLRNRVTASDHAQRTPSQSVRMRSRASGFATEQQYRDVHQQTKISQNLDLQGSVEGVQNQVAPEMRQSDKVLIARRKAAAIVWSRSENPVVSASVAGAQEIIVQFAASEMVGVEDRRTKGRLQVVKLADKQTAQPGEVISFSIEYENVGDLELTNVRVIDNLTPRLEYIPQSASSNLPATVDVVDNGEGSVVLTWTLKGPLQGKKKGVVSFQARVR